MLCIIECVELFQTLSVGRVDLIDKLASLVHFGSSVGKSLCRYILSVRFFGAGHETSTLQISPASLLPMVITMNLLSKEKIVEYLAQRSLQG